MKLFVFDVDDTLVDRDKILRSSTIRSLNKCLTNGDAIAIASGRPFIGINQYLSQLVPGLKFAIGANGAAVYDQGGKLLDFHGIPFKDFREFYASHQGIRRFGGEIYAYALNEVAYFIFGKAIVLEDQLNHVATRDLMVNPLRDEDMLLKFMTVLAPENSNRLHVSQHEKKKYHVMRSDPSFLEFTSPDVDKATGVEYLRRLLNISKREVFCFGDQGNDLRMIASFRGVAMGNAVPACKKVAEWVTLDVKNDGVSYALEKIIG